MAKPHQESENEKEIERRRDEIARRMLNTPPKPHKPLPAEKKEPSPEKKRSSGKPKR